MGAYNRSLAVHESQKKILVVADYAGYGIVGRVAGVRSGIFSCTVYLYIVLELVTTIETIQDSSSG